MTAREQRNILRTVLVVHAVIVITRYLLGRGCGGGGGGGGAGVYAEIVVDHVNEHGGDQKGDSVANV